MASFKKTRPTTTILFFFFTFVLVTLTDTLNSEAAIDHDQNLLQKTIQAFDVLHFGAIGDGIHDDTRAFLKAWHATCTAATGRPRMIVPKGKKFLVGPINFLGPCLTKIITVQISGTIVGPVTLKEWGWPNIIIRWIVFKNVDGLTVQGGGIINVRGNCWCENSCNNRNGKNRPGCSKTQPHSVNFISTSNSQLKDVTVTNSPKFHVTLLDLTNFNVTNLKVDSPEDSPNTDGLHSKALRMLASETVTSGAATIVFPLATAAFTSTSMIAIADLGMESVSGLWGSVGTGQRLKKFMCKE